MELAQPWNAEEYSHDFVVLCNALTKHQLQEGNHVELQPAFSLRCCHSHVLQGWCCCQDRPCCALSLSKLCSQRLRRTLSSCSMAFSAVSHTKVALLMPLSAAFTRASAIAISTLSTPITAATCSKHKLRHAHVGIHHRDCQSFKP
jgi:hypothetical protein